MPLTKILIFFFLREIISFGNLPRTAKYARSVAVRSKGIDHGTRREIGMGKLSKELRKLGIEISRTICYNTLTMQG